MKNIFKLICANDDYWYSAFNGDLSDAKKYFQGMVKVYADNSKTKVIEVIQIQVEEVE